MFVVVKGRIPAVLQNAILLELDRCNCVFSAVVLPRGGRSRSSLHWRVLCYLSSGFTVVDFSETLLSTSVQPSFVVGTGGILPPLQNKRFWSAWYFCEFRWSSTVYWWLAILPILIILNVYKRSLFVLSNPFQITKFHAIAVKSQRLEDNKIFSFWWFSTVSRIYHDSWSVRRGP